MKNLKFYFLFFILASTSSLVFAELPPPLKDVKISAVITQDTKSNIYTYTYEIYNPPINTLGIDSLNIDITSKPNDATSDNEGLVNGSCYHKYTSEYVSKQIKMIPVGMDVPPGYIPEYIEATGAYVTIWSCGLSARGSASWGTNDSNYMILPSQKLGGLKLTSYGLPGIRDAIVEQDYIVEEEDVPEDVFEEDRLKEYLDSVYTSIAFTGKTLGPTAPPADFKPTEFIDYIISMKHEATTLGWIKNQGVENSLDMKLENAKKSLERNSVTSAKNILKAFINEVEAQGCVSYDICPEGKHLTPEAYGLLKYKAEYLMKKL